MNSIQLAPTKIEPNLVRRACGGWLALAPTGAIVRIGVTASTEGEARDQFRFVFNRWVEILATDGKSGRPDPSVGLSGPV